MSEDEAEAAVLVLGPRLVWESRSTHSTGESYLIADVAGYGLNRYVLAYSRGLKKWLVRHVALPNSQQSRRTKNYVSFDSDADAKAACERHVATGKWE